MNAEPDDESRFDPALFGVDVDDGFADIYKTFVGDWHMKIVDSFMPKIDTSAVYDSFLPKIDTSAVLRDAGLAAVSEKFLASTLDASVSAWSSQLLDSMKIDLDWYSNLFDQMFADIDVGTELPVEVEELLDEEDRRRWVELSSEEKREALKAMFVLLVVLSTLSFATGVAYYGYLAAGCVTLTGFAISEHDRKAE